MYKRQVHLRYNTGSYAIYQTGGVSTFTGLHMEDNSSTYLVNAAGASQPTFSSSTLFDWPF